MENHNDSNLNWDFSVCSKQQNLNLGELIELNISSKLSGNLWMFLPNLRVAGRLCKFHLSRVFFTYIQQHQWCAQYKKMSDFFYTYDLALRRFYICKLLNCKNKIDELATGNHVTILEK